MYDLESGRVVEHWNGQEVEGVGEYCGERGSWKRWKIVGFGVLEWKEEEGKLCSEEKGKNQKKWWTGRIDECKR